MFLRDRTRRLNWAGIRRGGFARASFEIREAGINGLGPSETGGRGSLQLAGKRTTGRGRYSDVGGGSGKGKLRDGAGMAVGLKSEAGPGIDGPWAFSENLIWHFRRVFAGK